MKIVVIGPGALGCLLAASITLRPDIGGENACQVWLLDHDATRATELNKKGILLEKDGRQRHCPVRATANPAEIGYAEIGLLCVKSKDVQAGLNKTVSFLRRDSLLIALQNGISHLPLLESSNIEADIAAGVTAQGANLLGPSHVRHAGEGITRIGLIRHRNPEAFTRLTEAAALLNDSGIATATVPDIVEYIWAKLFINAGINALTALHSCPNGRLLDSEETRKQLTAAVREAEAVARAKGITVTGDPVAETIKICRATAANISSMLQDVRKKRPTEINAINGAIVAEARNLGIPTPTNEILIRQIKELEKNYQQEC